MLHPTAGCPALPVVAKFDQSKSADLPCHGQKCTPPEGFRSEMVEKDQNRKQYIQSDDLAPGDDSRPVSRPAGCGRGAGEQITDRAVPDGRAAGG